MSLIKVLYVEIASLKSCDKQVNTCDPAGIEPNKLLICNKYVTRLESNHGLSNDTDGQGWLLLVFEQKTNALYYPL